MKRRTSMSRLDPTTLFRIVRFARRYRNHPEELEPWLEMARKNGATDADIAVFRDFFTSMREAAIDRGATYRIDQYLTAGVGAIDLVLLPTILPLGISDQPLTIALLSLSISLVCVGTSLFVSFVKRDLQIATYGSLHSTVIFGSQLFGIAALTATLWHFSRWIALTFLALAIVSSIVCLFYLLYARTGIGFVRKRYLVDLQHDQSDSNESRGQHEQ